MKRPRLQSLLASLSLVALFATVPLHAFALDTDKDGIPDEVDSAPTNIALPGFSRLYTLNGDGVNDYFGRSVSAAGDVNNDGYDDVIVGAYADDNTGTDSGSTRIVSGVNGSILYTFNGDSAYDYFGWSASAAGDVNNDGYADVIVGALYDDNNGPDSGSARVLSGANGSILYTVNGDSASDYFGYSVSDAGDVNNDGFADVIVGAYGDDNNGTDSGSARVFSGVNGGILYTFNGDSAGDSFGYAVSSAGDVNNDGFADVLVGAYGDDNNGTTSGSARVFSGANGAILYTFNGDSASDYFGWSVSAAGDVNNDGYADVIVGAYQDDNTGTDSGSARVFSGANGAILYTFNGDSASDYFGYSVSAAGDVNNDGYADVIVGAYGDDNTGTTSGSARVFSGASGAILYTFNGDSGSDYFGISVSAAGDVNNDGYDDLISGAHQDDNTGSNSGSAFVYSGALLLAWTPVDTDGDGVVDGQDAFPNNAAEWADTDADGIGNNADPSDDGDAVADASDNCPTMANDDQLDFDTDGSGDVCDADDDNDGVADVTDTCHWLVNLNQLDSDGDGFGDMCDTTPYPPSGSVNGNFNPGTGANSTVWATAVQTDEKILIGGEFTTFNGVSRRGIARINSNGSLDTTFNPGTGINGSYVNMLAVQPDGDVVIVGLFSQFNGVARNNLARLNSDGSLDTTFNTAGGANAPVYAVALQADGKILIGGDFTVVGGYSYSKIARLNSNGSVDTSFVNPSLQGAWVGAIAVQPDGKVLIGGVFSSVGGNGGLGIARLNADGSYDSSFAVGSGVNQAVYALWLQDDGKVLLGGGFTAYNGTTINRIARLNTDGSLDTGFNPGTGVGGVHVYTIAMKQNKIVIGGGFDTYNGQARSNMARLNYDGSLDTTFNQGAGANNHVYASAFNNSGDLFIGGAFTQYDGIARNRVSLIIAFSDHDNDGVDNGADPDDDNDGVSDLVDNCYLIPNAGQENADSDITGDACDANDDNDSFLDGVDNCPTIANDDQLDLENDGIGNVCDPDDDGDGAYDVTDNCPVNANANQADLDVDGEGDSCDDDLDGDTIANVSDNCPLIVNPNQNDADGDGFGNACDSTIYGDVDFDGVGDLDDNCPSIANANQRDTDNDRKGDVCDASQGGTEMAMVPGQKIYAGGGEVIVKVLPSDAGYTSELYLSSPAPARFIATNRDTNTVVNLGVYPAGQELIFKIHVRNTNKDFYTGPASRNSDNKLHAAADLPAYGPSTVGFEDLDGGGDQDFNDNMFRFLGLSSFVDTDGDGTGDYYDEDDDGDGTPDAQDEMPMDASETLDTDHDGTGNNADTDDDGDGVADGDDLYPLNASESADSDGDGTGNNADPSDDGDGIEDGVDNCPSLANDDQADNDGDVAGDVCDADDDNDGVDDTLDNCPLMANTNQYDNDNDGSGNVCDASPYPQAGSLDSSFLVGTGFNADVWATEVQPDGKAVIGGEFTSYNGVSRNRIARLNQDGSLDTSFNPGTGVLGYYVNMLAIQPDGKIVIVGDFSKYNNVTRNSVARLNSNGSLDTTFSTLASANSAVYAVAVQPDGKIIIGGAFTAVGGLSYAHLARLNVDGTVDTTFTNPAIDPGWIATIVVQADGKILVGGTFTAVGGQARNGVVRLNANGSLDTTFVTGTATGVSGVVYHIVQQEDGKILIGGAFSDYNGTARRGIARLNLDGSLDASFDPGTGINGDHVYSIATAKNRIIIGGGFSSFNGIQANNVARLKMDGSVDTEFQSGTGANGYVWASRLRSDGDIIIGGAFTAYNGTSVNRVARLHGVIDLDNDGIVDLEDLDDDGDGVEDEVDNCPAASNAAQTNTDRDAFGNACDDDDDGDGVADAQDALPLDRTESLDADQDGIGDNADTDDDNDNITDVSDNCLLLANSDQLNTDGDAQGNACDADDDNDGVADTADRFPLNVAVSVDTDLDGFANSWNAACNAACQAAAGVTLDNCPANANADQANADGDSQGNVCDLDDDNDGIADTDDRFPLNASASADTDADGAPNTWLASCNIACQLASGLQLDNCPDVANVDQLNTDGDAQGNACDSDDDNDGVADTTDSFPQDATRSLGHTNILYTRNGDSAGDYFGISVSAAGDVNGDGFVDVIVGAQYDDNTGTDSGSARVLSGVNGSILYTFNGDSTNDYFGISVSGAGDVNNDGFADVIVGAYQDDNTGMNSGSARVFSGANGSILYTFNGDSASDYFGYSVSGAGDVNNDGYDDVIVGAYYDDNTGMDSGSARVFSGANGSILYTFNGDSASDWFGRSVSAAGDVNNDGYADVIVGAFQDDNTAADSGSARVLSGVNGSILYTFNGDSAGDYFGYSVSAAGDVNNDGYSDVIVGAQYDDNTGANSGSARVFSGANGSILYTFNGDNAGDYFGISVSAAGDVNNDGYADVIVGAYYDDNRGTESGSARVFSGVNGSILYTFNGDNAVDYFGYSVSAVGDVNHDGYADVIVGAYADDNSSTNSGSVRVFSGKGLWSDFDADGQNDAVDTDDDNDNVLDIDDIGPQNPALTTDVDGDGIDGTVDNCPTVNNTDQLNTDGDAKGNACDADDDNDGADDTVDRFPLDAAESVDTDNDGTGNNADADDDNDGLSDTAEATATTNPLVADTDGDGLLDGAEVLTHHTNPKSADSDNDGMPDSWEISNNLNPLNGNDDVLDNDGDGWTNEQEQQRGTNPNSAASKPASGSAVSGYIVAGDTCGSLYRFDATTGAIVLVGSTGVSGDCEGLAVGPDGNLYAADDASSKLYRINRTTGTATLVGAFTVSGTEYGLEFDEAGQLWLLTGSGSLYTLNTTTGVATLRASLSFSNSFGLGYSNGYLYTVNSNYLYRITTTGTPTATLVGSTGGITLGAGQYGLSKSADGTLWAVDENTRNVYTLNTTTGAGTLKYTLTSTVQYESLAMFGVLDTDSDGLPDTWEDANSLNKNGAADALLDKDSDGLINLQEYLNGTNPSVADTDGDGWNDYREVMVERTNPLVFDVIDSDHDGMSDAWEDTYGLNKNNAADAATDTDSDGLTNLQEFQVATNPTLADTDSDSVSDGVDNCRTLANANQLNTDGDVLGNACDTDDDNDGVADTSDAFPLNAAASVDSDLDGVPNSWNAACNTACQLGSTLTLDNCPSTANVDQLNTDGDTQGNACDADDDNDGVADTSDAFPLNAAEVSDADGDGTGDNADLDDDNDNVADTVDNCRFVANTDQADANGNGKGDVCDYGAGRIATGYGHSCAITTGGGLKCWGANGNGALGNGSVTQSAIPVMVSGLNSGVTAVAAGNGHTCALTSAGAVKCWGNNTYGQLGDGTTAMKTIPVDVVGLGSGVKAIAAGLYHSCALTTAGVVKCWGSNGQSQLGGGTSNSSIPVTVSGLGTVAEIALGGYHSCAVTTSGAAMCWGYNYYGQLGDNTTVTKATPVQVIGLGSGIKSMAAGVEHTCALNTSGGISCWGANGYGRLGNGTSTASNSPVAVTALASGVVAITAGSYHTCAVSTGGAMTCWGYNLYGQVGDNTTVNKLTPIAVNGLGAGVTSISAGFNYTCALVGNGAKCWGANGNGQVGDNSTAQRNVPVNVYGWAPQTITVTQAAPASAAFGSSFTVAATASSGLPVTISTAGGCYNNGNAVTMSDSATNCVVYYRQTGNANYAPAVEVFSVTTVFVVDSDGDGVLDDVDAFPHDASETLDTDWDGVGNNTDWDDDGDGVQDSIDVDPLDGGNATEIVLPLNGTFKGSTIIDRTGVQ